jgi:hypothetical protein
MAGKLLEIAVKEGNPQEALVAANAHALKAFHVTTLSDYGQQCMYPV